MLLVQQALTKIVYLQNILLYVDMTPLELPNMKLVHTSWHECVTEYGTICIKNIVVT
jgi:ubiquitin-protein ligase